MRRIAGSSSKPRRTFVRQRLPQLRAIPRLPREVKTPGQLRELRGTSAWTSAGSLVLNAAEAALPAALNGCRKVLRVLVADCVRGRRLYTDLALETIAERAGLRCSNRADAVRRVLRRLELEGEVVTSLYAGERCAFGVRTSVYVPTRLLALRGALPATLRAASLAHPCVAASVEMVRQLAGGAEPLPSAAVAAARTASPIPHVDGLRGTSTDSPSENGAFTPTASVLSPSLAREARCAGCASSGEVRRPAGCASPCESCSGHRQSESAAEPPAAGGAERAHDERGHETPAGAAQLAHAARELELRVRDAYRAADAAPRHGLAWSGAARAAAETTGAKDRARQRELGRLERLTRQLSDLSRLEARRRAANGAAERERAAGERTARAAAASAERRELEAAASAAAEAAGWSSSPLWRRIRERLAASSEQHEQLQLVTGIDAGDVLWLLAPSGLAAAVVAGLAGELEAALRELVPHRLDELRAEVVVVARSA